MQKLQYHQFVQNYIDGEFVNSKSGDIIDDINPATGEAWGANKILSGLNMSQGQLVTSDGGARQSNDADLGPTGVLEKEAEKATGGVATGRTSLALIR